jgi:2-oxo-3-hexenedioate decarboxylase
VLGGPLTALAFLVDLLKKQPAAPPLRAGEIISTGTLTDAHPVAPGETWRTEVTGFGGLTLAFS